MSEEAKPGRSSKDTRFQKGHSGNYSGRPKGSGTMLSTLTRELGKTIEVTENGKKRTITKMQALMTSLTNGAIKGDARAASLLITWLMKLNDGDPNAKPQLGLSAAERQIIEDHLNHEADLRAAQSKQGVE